jgi:hypothetical protein
VNTLTEQLWRRLQVALKKNGVPMPENLTPAEIADKARAVIGDDRVSRFVRDYYYPKSFGEGQLTHSLSDLEAEEIVISFEPRPRRVADRPEARRTNDSNRPCAICGRSEVK